MSKKRDEVFNKAISVLDSENSSHLPLLPSPLICTVGLRKRFKCRFWTWEVASFFCSGISPSQPSCGLTLHSLQHPGNCRGWCWGCCCPKLGWIQRETPGISTPAPWIPPLLFQHWRKAFRRGDSPCLQTLRPALSASLCLSTFLPVGLLPALPWLMEKVFSFLHFFSSGTIFSLSCFTGSYISKLSLFSPLCLLNSLPSSQY